MMDIVVYSFAGSPFALCMLHAALCNDVYVLVQAAVDEWLSARPSHLLHTMRDVPPAGAIPQPCSASAISGLASAVFAPWTVLPCHGCMPCDTCCVLHAAPCMLQVCSRRDASWCAAQPT